MSYYCKQIVPFFQFYIRYPYAAYTETVTITNMQVDTYYGGYSEGRLFNFNYASGGSTTPSSDQVTVTTSSFKNMYFDGDGAWAKV